ncbi:MAG TPA: branched-chain amino acid ABC transporter permease [Thermodesulfobacteriota bacterium]|nr:branched-chain amino acid ABC transporter permease [Thermodesulfobacteriota bacterium]
MNRAARNRRNWTRFLGLVVALLLPIVFQDAYLRNILVIFGIYCLLALSLNIIVGYIGEVSLGHAAFFGLGGYASAILSKTVGFPVLLSIPSAVVISGILGLFIGYLALRLRGPYFAITTLAFAEIIRLIVTNWVDLTRGPLGFTQIPPLVLGIPGWFEFKVMSELRYYYFVLVLVGLVFLLIYNVVHSPTGRTFLAIREQEPLARSVGISPFRYRVLAFVISTMIAGLAGAAYAHFFRIISPDINMVYYSAIPLMMVMVGGRGTLLGPFLGALLFAVLPELFRTAGTIRMVFFASFLLATIVYMPEGIAVKIQTFIRDWETKKSPQELGDV